MRSRSLLMDCAELHSAPTVAELARRSLAMIARATSADCAVFALTDNDRGRCAGAFWPDDCSLPAHMPAYEAHWHENPVGARHSLRGDDRVCRLADAIDRRDLERLAFYNEYLRPPGLRDMMTGYMARQGAYRLALTVLRGGRGRRSLFNVRERDDMEIVRRHTVVAFQNLARLSPLCGSPISVSDLLDSDLHTGMVIRDESDDVSAAAASSAPSRRAPRLTPAEQRVLAWMCAGKTNPEIAIILGRSVRTVHKHVEHILEKLAVENRVSAVVETMAMRLLDPPPPAASA